MKNKALANEIERRLAECTAKKIFPNVKLLGWENIKMAIAALRANAAPQAGESQSFPQGCSVSDPRTDSNDKSRPAVAAPEQQELIAQWAEKTAKYIDYFRGSPLFDLKAYLYERAEALSRSHEDGRRAGLEEKYYELLLQVGNKYPGESRHETALRYLRQAETSVGDECSVGSALKTQKGGA